jgi:hypothetical protein
MVRATGRFAGIVLVLRGAAGVLSGEGRGAAAAIMLGMVVLYWASVRRMPSWFRR